MDSQYKFKSSFAGFKREDVIHYIEKISNDFFDYRKESEATVKELQQRIEMLENRINELDSCDSREDSEPGRHSERDGQLASRLDGFFEKYKQLKANDINKEKTELFSEDEPIQTQDDMPEQMMFSKNEQESKAEEADEDQTEEAASGKDENKDELLDNFDIQFIEQLRKILEDY